MENRPPRSSGSEPLSLSLLFPLSHFPSPFSFFSPIRPSRRTEQVPRSVPRATTSQKCVRTNDIENVGATARHHTFFEMLGNFSFGDYFKREAIAWAWELSTREFRLPPSRVWVSVYEEDDEAFALWRDGVGVPPARIKRMGAADNFWASGPTGPCGPCSELYYDFHPERGTEGADLGDDTRFIEFYNLVFMESNRTAGGALEPLAARSIDTGMGLERMAQILQGVPNNYETDLLRPIMDRAAELAGIKYDEAGEDAKTSLKVRGGGWRGAPPVPRPPARAHAQPPPLLLSSHSLRRSSGITPARWSSSSPTA